MKRNKNPEAEKDQDEQFLLIQGNWVANAFSYGKVATTRGELAKKGYSADALLAQGLIRPGAKPELAVETPVVAEVTAPTPAAPEATTSPETAPESPSGGDESNSENPPIGGKSGKSSK